MAVRKYPELMVPGQVAEVLKTDARTVARWADAGRLRSIRTPGITGVGHRRYLRAEIDALIAGKPLTAAELDALQQGRTQ